MTNYVYDATNGKLPVPIAQGAEVVTVPVIEPPVPAPCTRDSSNARDSHPRVN